jgi:hypothetical protein
MSQPSYRALRVVLGFLSLLMAIGGVFLIFSNKAPHHARVHASS